MAKVYHVRPISNSNYILKGSMIKIPVIDNNNKNYTLAYPFEKELLPPEYLQKHNFREIFTSIPLNDSQLN